MYQNPATNCWSCIRFLCCSY